MERGQAYAALPNNFAKAFKPADIRGIYPKEIDEAVAYRVGRAFVSHYRLPKVALGRDMRLSSPSLRDAFVRGATEQGADVIDFGMIDTPGLYFASGKHELYGAMLTASHNPAEYNGIKLVKPGAVPLTDTDGLPDIRALVERGAFSDAPRKGKAEERPFFPEYAAYVRSLVSVRAPRTIAVVVDAGNGMATLLAPLICEGLPVKVHPLFFGLDGRFPNRGSNPTLAENTRAVRAKVREVGADFGVAFDGDVDRAAFFDETGAAVNSAVVGAVIARHLLSKKPSAVVYTDFTSRAFFEAIAEGGGEPVKARVGHSFVTQTMRAEDAVFGCEHSGHFYFKENFYTDSGILAFLRVLEAYAEAAGEGLAFSDMTRPFDRYRQSEEVLITVADKPAVLAEVEERMRALRPERVRVDDGLSVSFPDYWFTLKESVTEDALKLVLEATTEEGMRRREREVLALVRSLADVS